ncbi:ATP-binding cassette domain-containing protein [Glaciimonas sp. PAMC28666]|uniref:branched-chain amino acid ABC transporter ATP-binding protein/permease n=1 Tax=Glaciimonas sp. PAMC28666 TaxID=2807626 RepID=UPI001962FCB4|nr:branched-chain amino acid ABC transporter ATP-binding protein/permease [Glaciimonas sp. PAMC28666]QRX83713.1 branched-chain amino acid ABC transporter ATP-binding protein/permease [Glaciimonas sp. PAMC28666]
MLNTVFASVRTSLLDPLSHALPSFFKPAKGSAIKLIVQFAVLYLAVTMLVSDPYYGQILTLTPIWATLAVSWNLFSGYSGLMSFGHAAFFGLGAYTVVLLEVKLGISPWIGIPIAALVGGLSGGLIGASTFRLRGHYFALAMLAYPLGILYVFEWLGLQEVTFPRHLNSPISHMQFADVRFYAVLAVALLLIAVCINLRVARSRFGLSLLAIKQNELAAEAAGIDPFSWKLRAIVLSGAIAGAAGGLYAVVMLIVTPNAVFGMLISAQALIFSLFGGVGTIAGPVIGALVLVPVSELLNAELGDKIPGIQGVVFGLAIILTVLLAPEGILPKLIAIFAKRKTLKISPVIGAAFPHSALAPTPRAQHNGDRHEIALRVKALSKSFGGLQAVSEVSFDVFKNEILGVIGPNGAGKTTLFNLLNGILPATKGEVAWDGRNIVGLRPHQICRLGIGRTFQVVRAFGRLTTLQNVVVGAFAKEQRDEQAYALATAALIQVGMEADVQVLAGSLTMMQLRLMELARCLASKPKLILLDEILAGLGADDVEHLIPVIQNIRSTGVTVVIIEHTMHAMVRLADRLLVLDHGCVLSIGEPSVVTNDPIVIEAYLGKKWSARAANK